MLEFNFWFFILLVNFLVLVFLLNTILFKPLLAVFRERQKATEGALELADKLLKETDKAAQKLKKELAGARDKAKEIQNALRSDGMKKQKELMAASQEEAMKMIEEARKKLNKESAIARASLREEVEKYSTEIANKLIRV